MKFLKFLFILTLLVPAVFGLVSLEVKLVASFDIASFVQRPPSFLLYDPVASNLSSYSDDLFIDPLAIDDTDRFCEVLYDTLQSSQPQTKQRVAFDTSATPPTQDKIIAVLGEDFDDFTFSEVTCPRCSLYMLATTLGASMLFIYIFAAIKVWKASSSFVQTKAQSATH